MANSDKAPTLLPHPTTQEQQKELPELNQGSGRADLHKAQPLPLPAPSKGDFATPPTASADQAKTTSPPTDSQPTPPPARPTLVQLPSAPSQPSSSSPVAPHPKKFSAVNINKKFLEKNSSATTAAPSSSISSSAKSGSPVSRPQAQTSAHSRLVTTKLTATPSHSTGTAGWSRPSSVTPSPAATGSSSPSGTSPLPSAANIATAAPVAPQPPHAGKVIQPQPRTTLVQQGPSQKDPSTAKGANKPVWGNLKPPVLSTPARPDITPNDFPTAAEVANATTSSSRKPKPEETKPSTSDAAAAASRQARLEEADTFRGVHLDPNAHHWDEMEEDDDNFLVGVIEFGDGRQYKIDTTPEPPPDSPTRSGSGQNVSKEDRFGEDFDRSWPRSRASPATSARDFTSAPAGHPTASPASSTNPLHSPQESSRVLFNERSNKLEPYSHRPPPASYQSKRGSFESSGSNVQLLQKSGGAGEFSRPPALGRRESGFGQGPFGDRNRSERDIARRDVPTSPRITKDGFGHAMGPTTSWGGRDRDSDRGRRSDMGPPPLPTHTMRRPSREGGRQLPPHLAQVSPNIPPRRLPSRDSNMREPPVPSGSNRHPSQSPALSHRSLAAISPLSGGQATLPPLSAPELDEVRKDLMHTAAERAKQRREQEEAEREAQKERARKKAAELEVKMKAAEEAKAKEAEETAKKQRDEEENARGRAEESIKKANQAKEQQVLAVIEDAISSVKVSKTPSIGPQRRPLPSSTQQEPSRAGLSRRPSGNVPTPASESDSWRAKASPLPPSSPALRQTTSHTTSTSLLTPQSAMEQVGTIRKGSADDLEVVDFSDMGKFVSVPEGETPLVAATPLASTKPARPVASDFFEDKKDEIEAPPSATKSDFGTWRRQVVHDVSAVPATTKDAPSTKEPTLEEKSRATIVAVEATTIAKEQDRRNTTQVVTVPPHMVHNQRTPRGQSFYKESTMSALDDAMSRIKGALDASKESHPSGTPAPAPLPAVTETAPRVSLPLSGKPTPQPPQPPQPPKDRWIPPAMRQRAHEFHDAPTEVFDVTAVEPPLTPKPAWNSFTVKFPKYSRSLELVSKRQLSSFFRLPYAPRWDILSFDPPVEGMNRRDLSVNEILFRRPSGNFKGKPKFRVFLPKARLPSVGVKINGAGAFRKPTVADGAASWRKAPSTASKPQGNASMDLPTENGLDTTSRSPPPEVLHAQSNVASLPRSADSSLSKADSIVGSVRSRSIPKMPAGSAVAVLRDSRIDVIEADSESRVNFIVNSELEDGYQQDIGSLEDKVNATVSNALSPSDISSDSKPQVNGTKPPPTDPASKRDSKHQISSLASSKADKGSNDSTDTLSTPSTHHTSPWARTSLSLPVKELGVRAPDPEHLKAVWSQTSDKASSHAVNSLEGIADDLTALPFTLQDVKSEDGGTPPPAVPTAPSRMSLHDVTRAFQQVPSSSNSTTHRAPMSPPTTNAPVARPTPTTYSYSPIPSNIRPAYPYSPMMSHSPAPVMYTHQVASSPVPNRMSAVNGHPPLYSQPVWMHMAGPTPQNPGGMMRPVPSPYPGQMVTYPGTPMYPPPQGGMPPPNPQQQSNGMGPNRGRGMPLISPVMTHAGAAMYAGSPVLMPAPVMQNHGYMMPAGRGQTRPDNGQMGTQQHHPPSHSFNTAPPHNFARPTW